ncbi:MULTISPECIES: tyrosine-type recombinase/integrase [Nocardia]|uniref:tyrosine-type recombinase/integrase n=1 Tax=Nocardia TaxID=1817 RepID=UPI0024542E4A|nr:MULTISPECIES: tyrosine-type recombinase/integrase [Nocardia]
MSTRRRSTRPAARVDEPAAPLPGTNPAQAAAAPRLHLVPDTGPAIDPDDEIGAAAAAFRAKAVADNTRRTYASGWRRFESWCRDNKRTALPASPDTVYRFATWLALQVDEDGEPLVKASTITTWCAAIGKVHSQHGYTDPAADPAVRETLSGISEDRTSSGEDADLAAPIMTADLERFVGAISEQARTWRQQVAARRDIALLVLAFAGARRRSEVLNLQRRDLTVESDSEGEHIRIALRGTKTSRRKITYFVVERGQTVVLCPWCALLRWLVLLADYDHAVAAGGPDAGVVAVHKRLRLERNLDPHTHYCDRALPSFPSVCVPIFRSLARVGVPARMQPLTGQAFGRMIHARALAAGYSPAEAAAFRGHSLRAGATTQASDNGATYREIMNMTGHTQIDTVRKYDRAPLHRANATRKLGL